MDADILLLLLNLITPETSEVVSSFKSILKHSFVITNK